MRLFVRVDGVLIRVYPLTKPHRENPFVTVRTEEGDVLRVHNTEIQRDY